MRTVRKTDNLVADSEYQELDWLLNHWLGWRKVDNYHVFPKIISKGKFILFIHFFFFFFFFLWICLILCWHHDYLFFLVVRSHLLIDNFISDWFVLLINKTQHRRISSSATNSSDTVNRAELSADRDSWSWHSSAWNRLTVCKQIRSGLFKYLTPFKFSCKHYN